MLKRCWKAPGAEQEAQSQEKPSLFTMTPEKIKNFKNSLKGKWAFGEAGLETGMDRFVKMVLREAGAYDEEEFQQ